MSLIRRVFAHSFFVFSLLALCLACVGWRRPIEHRSPVFLPTFNFTVGVPAGINTARTGGTIYPMNATASTVHAVGANTTIFEDQHDGRGGGIWTFPAWSNFFPSPLAANTLTSGAHAGGDYGAGVNWIGMGNTWYLDEAQDHAARVINTAGTVTDPASPWIGFGNAIDMTGLTTSQALTMNGYLFSLPGTGFSLEYRFQANSVNGAGSMVFGKLGCCAASHQVLWTAFDNGANNIYCGMTDSTNAIHFAKSTTVPVANTPYVVDCDFDGTNLRILINGTLEATTATGGGIVAQATTLNWYFGNDDPENGGNLPFDGIVDEVRVSNISRHTTSYTPATTPFTPDANTLALWHFDTPLDTYAAGYADPLGGTGAVRFTADENANQVYLLYTAGGVGDNGVPTASVWVVDDATLPPLTVGALQAGGQSGTGTPGTAALGTGVTYRHEIATWFKAAVNANTWGIWPTNVTLSPNPSTIIPGTNIVSTWTANNTATVGGVHVWCPQFQESSSSDVPCLDGSTTAAVTSLDPSKFGLVLQAGGDMYVSGAYLEDPNFVVHNVQNTFTMNNADGATAFHYNASPGGISQVEPTINGVSLGAINVPLEGEWFYGVPAEVQWRMWSRPATDGKKGWQLLHNGCETAQVNQAAAPTMHAPTSFYIGSDNGSNALANRHSWLSFFPFRESDAAGFIYGDSIMALYLSVHMSVCVWTYTLQESRTRKPILDAAIVGDTVQGQQATFDAQYAAGLIDPQVGWFWLQVGVNNLNTGDSVALTTSRYQAFVNDIRGKFPSASLYLAPVTPCAPTGCNWTNVSAYNANIAGTGGTPITCTGKCIRVPTWDTALLLGDGTGTGTMNPTYDSGDHLHENDRGGRVIGTQIRNQLIANSDFPP